jgi:hypothetical protein
MAIIIPSFPPIPGDLQTRFSIVHALLISSQYGGPCSMRKRRQPAPQRTKCVLQELRSKLCCNLVGLLATTRPGPEASSQQYWWTERYLEGWQIRETKGSCCYYHPPVQTVAETKKSVAGTWEESYYHSASSKPHFNCAAKLVHFRVGQLFMSLDSCKLQDIYMSRGSLVDIATAYGLDDRGVAVRVPVGSTILTSPYSPDRLWGPHNLLFNWYRGLFPRG